MTDVPRVLADLTAEWLGQQLSATIDSIEVEEMSAGVGFMGQLARVHITTPDPGPPRSVVVKLPTTDPGGRAMGEVMGVWQREHCFYRDLAPRMAVRVPTAHVNVADPPCLVLEDLSAATIGDHVVGATPDQAERAIDELARHHAAWFEHPLLRELTWMPGLDAETVTPLAEAFTIGWPTFLDRFGGELPRRCLRWCERFAAQLPGWIAGHLDAPVTMTHGDYRLDNLFFFDDGSVAIIDWQLSMRAPGQADFVYFCANNLDVAARRVHDDALLRRYVEGLHAGGVPSDAVTLDSVRQGYLEGLVFYAVSFGAGLLTIDPANERGAALFEALVHRTFSAVDDLDAGVALGFPPTG